DDRVYRAGVRQANDQRGRGIRAQDLACKPLADARSRPQLVVKGETPWPSTIHDSAASPRRSSRTVPACCPSLSCMRSTSRSRATRRASQSCSCTAVPGGGTEPKQRRFFDPAAYRIVLFDQRGCGKSTPHACLIDNTTCDLVADTERLRQHLNIERWQLFGGSWGSPLSLAYAQTHPDRVTELVLRGIFLLRRQEIHWFYQQGADALFPDAWEEFLAPIPANEHDDLLRAYHTRLTSDDPAIRQAAAKAWSIWEGKTSSLHPNPEFIARNADDQFSLAFSRIECHYFVNGAFFDHDGQLLTNIGLI